MLITAIEKLTKSSFSVLDFTATFRRVFPDEWEQLVERFGLFGEKKRYTVSTYIANRLYAYSHKPGSYLKPFRKYARGGKGDYRRATKEEMVRFGSAWMAVYRRVEKRKS